jgi:hemerythrin-like domain-containing protein
MTSQPDRADFDILDACHRQIHAHLDLLSSLKQSLGSEGPTAALRTQAGAIESFFSRTARQHHADEDRTVFPALLGSGDADLVATVRSLQQDHGWLEENWIELAPQLRAIAGGNQWVEPAEFEHAAQVFITLCENHIAVEERLIYPASKARLATLQADRR